MEEQSLVSVWNRLLTRLEPVSHVVFLVESGSHHSSFNKSEVRQETGQWSDYASELYRSFQILMQSIPPRDEGLLFCKLPSDTTGLTTTPRFSSSLWTALSDTENFDWKMAAALRWADWRKYGYMNVFIWTYAVLGCFGRCFNVFAVWVTVMVHEKKFQICCNANSWKIKKLAPNMHMKG